MADDDAKKGTGGAHTPGDFGADEARAAKIGSGKAELEAAMTGLAQELDGEDEADQLPLMLDEQDEQQSLFSGPVRHVANKIENARRGRGRPKGSKNKANAEFRDVAMRMGYRHPGLNLLALANADPHELAAEMSEPYRPKKGPHAGELVEASVTPADALALILKANAELLPYFESKAPTKVDLPPERQLGVFFVGEMTIEQRRDDRVMDLTRFETPDE